MRIMLVSLGPSSSESTPRGDYNSHSSGHLKKGVEVIGREPDPRAKLEKVFVLFSDSRDK